MKPATGKFLVIGGKARRHWDLLESHFTKCATHAVVKASGEDAEGSLEECQKLKNSVLLIDSDSIKKVDPIVLARKVEHGKLIPILVLIEDETVADCESLLRMGCMGFLRSDAPSWQFCRAVEAVASGEIWAPRKFVSKVCRELLSVYDPLKLTAREGEVLSLLAAGHSNRKIADLLFISRETVRWHVRGIYRKLGVHDRAGALSFGILRPDQKPVRRKKNAKV